ncbi:ATP-binding cassette domain-containing protein [Paractinoplanes durhamensis]|uniref:ATP-binding cassette domain-containing protein n=1 Tax=Paractinoplanes durhamensis TaxID=113563 RepID=UPI0036266205
MVAADTPANRAVYAKSVTPALAAAGVTGTVNWIDTTDLGTLNTGLSQAAVNFRGKKIDRVFFFGGARIAPFFMTSAVAQNFTARYGISTFDSPSFMVANPDTIPPAALKGMVGVGFAPGYDVPDSQLPFPSTAAEKNCLGIYSAAGITFKARENARVAFTYCDAALLLQTAAKDLPDLTADAWGRAAQALGTSFATATGFGGSLQAGGNAAASGYRVLKFSDACSCFTYSGEVTPLASEPVLEVAGLSGGYGTIQVLFGIDLTVGPGETVALCGPNGVGKSTLVRMIAGLTRPSTGRITLHGNDITAVPAARRPRLGMSTVIGQQAFGTLSVRDNLRMHAYPNGRDEEKAHTAVDGALAVFPGSRPGPTSRPRPSPAGNGRCSSSPRP